MKYQFILFFSFIFSLSIYTQKYSYFSSDFTIKEIRENGEEKSSKLIIGQVEYFDTDQKSIYNISFPLKEKWIIQDSFLNKYSNDSLIYTKKVGSVNEFIMFKNILNYKDNDFGLSEQGFNIINVTNEDGELLLEWDPPKNFKTFLKRVTTNVKDNLLMGIIFEDVEGKEINKTFYDDYIIVKDLPVPQKITSQFAGQKENLYKSIAFKNVKVN